MDPNITYSQLGQPSQYGPIFQVLWPQPPMGVDTNVYVVVGEQHAPSDPDPLEWEDETDSPLAEYNTHLAADDTQPAKPGRARKIKRRPRLQPAPKPDPFAAPKRGRRRPKVGPAPLPRTDDTHAATMEKLLGRLRAEIADVGARRDGEEGNVVALAESRVAVKENLANSHRWIAYARHAAEELVLAGREEEAAQAAEHAQAMARFAAHYARRLLGHDHLLACCSERAEVYAVFVDAAEELVAAIEGRDAGAPRTFWMTRTRGLAVQVPLALCPAFWKVAQVQRELKKTVMANIPVENRGNAAIHCAPPYTAFRYLEGTEEIW